MARSRSRSGGSRRSGGAAARTPARKEKKAPVVAEVEVVEEEGGMGIDDGIILVTALMLFIAFLMTDAYRGKAYGTGLIWGADAYEAPAE